MPDSVIFRIKLFQLPYNVNIMKQFTTLITTLYLTLLGISSLTAQDIVMEDSLPPIEERIAWIFENLDFSEVTSGVLYDYGLNLEDFKDFPGDTTTGDTADFERFTLMYIEWHDSSLKLKPYSQNLELEA